MSDSGEFCPYCEKEEIFRQKRKSWMRFMPDSKHYECYSCGARFLSIFGGILEVPLHRARESQKLVHSAATEAPPPPKKETTPRSDKSRRSLTLVSVALVSFALGGFLGYHGFRVKADQQISQQLPHVLPQSSTPQEAKPAPYRLSSAGQNFSQAVKPQKAPTLPPAETVAPPRPEPVATAPLPEPQSPAITALPGAILLKQGQDLNSIVAKYYPKNKQVGLTAIVLANPEIVESDAFQLGQILKLPEIDPTDNTIKSEDNLYYLQYGRYHSDQDFQKHAAWLIKKKISFVIRNTGNPSGNGVKVLILGGYPTKEDLAKALEKVKTKSKNSARLGKVNLNDH